VQEELTATKTLLESGDPIQIGQLTREDLLGEMFQAGVLGYYAQYIALSYIAGLQQGAFHTLGAGLGSLGYEPKVDYFFGFPRAIEAGGVALNIPIINISGTKTPDPEQKKNFLLQIGVLSSALEHGVPEQMFVDADPAAPPPDAFSAVKALSKANSQGQHIYHLTNANQAATLPAIHHDGATMDEIRNALAVGKEVITHTDAVTVPGYSGAGYIIFDPVTGDGAYKIAGGANGSFLDDYPADGISTALFLITLLSFLQSAPLALSVALMLFAVLLFHTFIVTLIADLKLQDAGCPEGLSYLLFAASASFFVLPKVYKTHTKLQALVISLYNFIVRNAITAVAPACRGLP
jgi:hypothetical protein